MTTSAISQAQRSAARIAGIVWPISFITVVAVNFGIFGRLVTGQSPAATAQNILAHETLFRIGIAGDVLYCVGVVLVASSLYTVLKPVSANIALLAALGRLIHGLTWLLVSVNHFALLLLLTEQDYLRAMGPEHLFALVRLYLGSGDTYYIGLLFWSLGTVAGSYLWFKSNYVPRALAIFGLASSTWCAACTFIYYIFPDFSDIVNLWWFDSPMGIFELALSLWLVFKGLKSPRIVETGPQSVDAAVVGRPD